MHQSPLQAAGEGDERPAAARAVHSIGFREAGMYAFKITKFHDGQSPETGLYPALVVWPVLIRIL